MAPGRVIRDGQPIRFYPYNNTIDSKRAMNIRRMGGSTLRRRDGAKYVVTWTRQWMDMKPFRAVVDEALGESEK